MDRSATQVIASHRCRASVVGRQNCRRRGPRTSRYLTGRSFLRLLSRQRILRASAVHDCFSEPSEERNRTPAGQQLYSTCWGGSAACGPRHSFLNYRPRCTSLPIQHNRRERGTEKWDLNIYFAHPPEGTARSNPPRRKRDCQEKSP